MSQGHILLDGNANDVLGQEEILATTYVDPPQLTRLGKRLGFTQTVRNQEEFLAQLSSRSRKNIGTM
jgi:energy-coupling factor transport system ATP-binding protein